VTDSTGSTRNGYLRTVFLDRDGVLNEKMPEGQYVTRWEEFHVLPGVPEAIARLNKAGARVLVVSNQRGIALGLFTVADLEAMHERFQEVLAAKGAHVDGFYFCPHDSEGCNCRKPLPGMFEQAQRDFPEINAETSAMVGDSLSDIVFGRQLGMRTVLVEGDPEMRRPGTEAAVELADMRLGSLGEAVQGLLGSSVR
jgi:D-glycero-D-manno-heptose 1,7-bisphosphate phosphatase